MDPNRVTTIYDEIGQYVIELEADPTALGVRYLNELISRCRNYLNRVSILLGELGKERRDISSALRAAEAVFQVSFDELLANDERVKRLPNITDRTATVNMLLREQRDHVESLKRELQDLEYVEKAVRHRHNELKSTNTDIKMQRQMVRDELDTGSFYGDEGSTGKPLKAPLRSSADDLDESDIDAILKGSSIAGSVLPVDPEPSKEDLLDLSSEAEQFSKTICAGLQVPVEMLSSKVVSETTDDSKALEAFLAGSHKATLPVLVPEDEFFRDLSI